ncbi:glyoxalase/bleomycin resistance/dioxygenase family protein [Peribacillus simplex]|uniref:Glyoxalase/bleomycin resistance/dioxygenase family protein n=2 Tax=Peribacillus TaxID=2675229 RepID=A0AA90P4C1_9BACI|nr:MULTISPECIES: glyoxalase/bleomycin resistance/dioxygenase family protein [Peribacillus]MDP1420491.1 glyoxalase/bleomycin resistance/dioxygenase family protein [Peribacillus simplex]MDP1453384.1 glyoxalase/bleomycin resistance/dioxygenase family protein [Peribacillus frigoritolerans]
MITHFADLELLTVSIEGVKQCYAKRLQFPILTESKDFIQFQLTPFTTLSFKEAFEPISPAHFAFQVPYSHFDEVVSFVQQSGLLVLSQEQGQYIDETNGRKNLYFRDGDGNLLEIIAHDYVNEDELKASGMLQVLYLREIGFPVDSVPILREWLKSHFGMKTEQDQDIFNFVISGTAHAIVVSKQRPWIPIAMKALPPKMAVTFGTPNKKFINDLSKQMDHTFLDDSKKQFLSKDSYSFYIEHTPEFSAAMVENLNLSI